MGEAARRLEAVQRQPLHQRRITLLELVAAVADEAVEWKGSARGLPDPDHTTVAFCIFPGDEQPVVCRYDMVHVGVSEQFRIVSQPAPSVTVR